MARPVQQVATGAGALKPIPLNNLNGSPFNVGVTVDVSAGSTLTYNVEYTVSDVLTNNAYNPAADSWFLVTGLTGSADLSGTLTAPVTAVRLNVTLWSAGTATFTVIQTN